MGKVTRGEGESNSLRQALEMPDRLLSGWRVMGPINADLPLAAHKNIAQIKFVKKKTLGGRTCPRPDQSPFTTCEMVGTGL